MEIDSNIDKVRWFSNFLNSIVDRYENDPEFFDNTEKIESLDLLSTILRKINDDYSVSIMMFKNNLLTENNYGMDIDDPDITCDSNSDTNSDLSQCCSIGSDNFLYNGDGSDCDLDTTKLELNDESDDDSLYGDKENKVSKSMVAPLEIKTDLKNVRFSENNTISDSNKEENQTSNKEDIKENFLTDKVNLDKIILYKKHNKEERLSNYLENSYVY